MNIDIGIYNVSNKHRIGTLLLTEVGSALASIFIIGADGCRFNNPSGGGDEVFVSVGTTAVETGLDAPQPMNKYLITRIKD